MKLNTVILFQELLKMFKCEMLLDIGCLDGTHSRRFRRVLPKSRIIAFEANPTNYKSIMADVRMKEAQIEVQHLAVTNFNGILQFQVENLSANIKDGRKGMSSILKRKSGSLGITEVEIPSIRIDSFLTSLDKLPDKIALWIDVEGAAFEVLEGIGSVKEKIAVVHVEVETKEIWTGQKLENQILELMSSLGFVPIAHGHEDIQRDLVFVNNLILKEYQSKISQLLRKTYVISKARRLVGNTLRKIGLKAK